MTADMSVVGLLLEASLPVQIVMLLLMIASLMSWSIIFTKRRLIRRTKDSSDEFEASFWSGGDLNTLYNSVTRESGGSVGMANMFESGFREFNRVMQQGAVNPDKVVEECRRAMRVAQVGDTRCCGTTHCRGADRNGDGFVRGYPGCHCLQSIRRQGRTPRISLRRFHRGVLEHPAAPRERQEGSLIWRHLCKSASS
jgi:hypothetical protein